MITFTKAYATSDGKTFATLLEAQAYELSLLWPREDRATYLPAVIGTLLANLPAVLNILSTTATSRPKGRKANGATRKRPTRVDPLAGTFKQTAE